MVYVSKSKGTVQIFLPLNGFPVGDGEKTLAVRSTVDGTTLQLTPAVICQGRSMMLEVAIDTEALFAGEWEYTFAIGGEMVSRGILTVTEEAEGDAVYNKTITYKQYGE